MSVSWRCRISTRSAKWRRKSAPMIGFDHEYPLEVAAKTEVERE